MRVIIHDTLVSVRSLWLLLMVWRQFVNEIRNLRGYLDQLENTKQWRHQQNQILKLPLTDLCDTQTTCPCGIA